MTQNLMDNFKRDISYSVSRRDERCLLLTATMRDVYHDIVLEVLVASERLTIEGILVEFRKCPEALCSRAAERLQLLVGATIGKGLNRKILEAAGGGAGCGNLRNLLSGLLPLAMNVKAAEGFSDEQAMLDSIRHNLQGSCAGYRLENTRITDKETEHT